MILYRTGYKYQLAKNHFCQIFILPNEHIVSEFITLEPSGKMFIKKGYAWDGPSGPTVDTKSFMRGSLIHDALYQLMREGKLKLRFRKEADQELRRLCIEDGMSRIRAWWVFVAVDKFARQSSLPENKKDIITAP